MMLRLLLSACLLLATGQLAAHDFRLGDLRIVHPFATPTPPTAQVGAVYLDITNNGSQPARLISARAHVAETVEIHDMRMESGIMRMRQVNGLDLPTGETLRMRPGGGYHLMLIGLKQPIKAGEGFPVWLTFEGLGEIQVQVVVHQDAERGSQAAESHHHH